MRLAELVVHLIYQRGNQMISDTKKKSQISLTLDTLKKLETYAKSDGFTKSAIIELALEKLFSERAIENW